MKSLLQHNPFRTLGLFANAKPSDIELAAMRLRSRLSIGVQSTLSSDLNQLLPPAERTVASVDEAEQALGNSELRIPHAQFWFIKRTAIDGIAISHLMSGNIDSALAVWMPHHDFSALHNAALCHLLLGDKEQARQLAARLYADKAQEWLACVAPDANISDASLLALWQEHADRMEALAHPQQPDVLTPPVTGQADGQQGTQNGQPVKDNLWKTSEQQEEEKGSESREERIDHAEEIHGEDESSGHPLITDLKEYKLVRALLRPFEEKRSTIQEAENLLDEAWPLLRSLGHYNLNDKDKEYLQYLKDVTAEAVMATTADCVHHQLMPQISAGRFSNASKRNLARALYLYNRLKDHLSELSEDKQKEFFQLSTSLIGIGKQVEKLEEDTPSSSRQTQQTEQEALLEVIREQAKASKNKSKTGLKAKNTVNDGCGIGCWIVATIFLSVMALRTCQQKQREREAAEQELKELIDSYDDSYETDSYDTVTVPPSDYEYEDMESREAESGEEKLYNSTDLQSIASKLRDQMIDPDEYYPDFATYYDADEKKYVDVEYDPDEGIYYDMSGNTYEPDEVDW